MTATEHIDVIVVGAGLSGIGAGYYLQERCPGRSYAILEGREAMGGTWDLFRYPGIRSDSDMHTLGFRFNPWPDPEAIADGPSILRYIQDTARKFGIDRRIRYQHYVTSADWSSADKHWRLTVELRATGEIKTITTNFLVMCSGYYDYDEGYYGRSGGCSGVGCADYALQAADDFDANHDGANGEATTVVVENEFSVGIYEIVILSAEESGDLLTWLGANGFAGGSVE